MQRFALIIGLLAAALSLPARAADLAPTGTLRAAYLGSNLAQARLDPATGTLTGPAADLARELARRLGVPVAIKPVASPRALIDTVRSGAADIGFLAYDPARAGEVGFSQTYLFAWNTYLVPEASGLRSVADVDQPGVRVGVVKGDAGHLYLERTLKQAELKPNASGSIETMAAARFAAREIDAYAANRTRLIEAAAKLPGVRILPDNFLGVEQCIVVAKGDAAKLEIVNRLLDETRASGFIQSSVERTGMKGVDVAPYNPR